MSPAPPPARHRRFFHLRLVGLLASLACAGIATGRAQYEPRERGNFLRTMIFFPPVPPPLDRPVAHAQSTGTGPGAAPPELAPYISEFFYPQLGSRLGGIGSSKLPEKLQQALDAYANRKRMLTGDLQEELEKQRLADAPTRLAALEALARRQALSLAQLDQQAEQLRRDLLDSDRDWSYLREWHLSDKPRRGFSPFEIAQVMRAYAYYQDGLLPAQRRLLLEIAVELAVAVDDAAKAATAQPYLFFSPEPARITPPDNISAEVAAKLATYQTKKSVLKKQLYDAVCKHDGSALAFLHNTLKSVADQQAGPLAEIETLAEDIRRKMAEQSAAIARPREKSPLSPALVERINALLRDRSQALRDATAKVEELLETTADLRVNYRFEADGLKFVVLPRPRTGGGPSGPAENQRADLVTHQLDVIADNYSQRIAHFMTERDAIRKLAAIEIGSTTEAAVDKALDASARAYQAQESATAYDVYRTAVFEPGLSIQQRRLLLDEAVCRLSLPLPKGDLQPIRRGESW